MSIWYHASICSWFSLATSKEPVSSSEPVHPMSICLHRTRLASRPLVRPTLPAHLYDACRPVQAFGTHCGWLLGHSSSRNWCHRQECETATGRRLSRRTCRSLRHISGSVPDPAQAPARVSACACRLHTQAQQCSLEAAPRRTPPLGRGPAMRRKHLQAALLVVLAVAGGAGCVPGCSGPAVGASSPKALPLSVHTPGLAKMQ